MAHRSEDLNLNPPAARKPDAGLQVTVRFSFEVRVREGAFPVPQTTSWYRAQREASRDVLPLQGEGRQDQHLTLPLTRECRYSDTAHSTHTLKLTRKKSKGSPEKANFSEAMETECWGRGRGKVK